MNVETLMSKTVTVRQPLVGLEYFTKNWDGTHDMVKVARVVGDQVVVQYTDGVCHRVSILYFWEGLRALLVQ
jgi:hypothetical protein